MLVVRRRAGEAIVLGGGIEIEVMEISRTRVKLGVRAPRDVTVIRREVATVAAENRRASDLMAHRGQQGVGELLRRLRNLPAENSKAAPGAADM
ncbi:MAG: carbon storage regulator [Acidobacteriota bacterium]